jgi:prophage maintenance system killer protein
MIDYLTVEDLVEVARRVIDGEVVVRDAGLLASAVSRPQSSVFGQDAYPGVWEKAAAFSFSNSGTMSAVSSPLPALTGRRSRS